MRGLPEPDDGCCPVSLKTFFLALLLVGGASALSFNHTYAYFDNAGADSLEQTRSLVMDTNRGRLIAGSYSDDAVNIWNISGANLSRIYYLGGRTSSAHPASQDGATEGFLWRDVYFIASDIDDSFSILNVSTNTPVAMNNSPTDAAPPQSQDLANDVAVTEFGGTLYAVVAAFNDDSVTVWNVTNPLVAPTYLAERVSVANPCSTDGAYSVEFINSTDFLIASQVSDTISWLRLASTGAITCVSHYVNGSDIDRLYDLAYDNTTGIVYSGGLNNVVTALNISSGSFVKLGQVAANGTPNGEGEFITVNGFRYGLFPLHVNGQGLAVVNVSDPSALTLTRIINGTAPVSNVANLNACDWNISTTIGVTDSRIYVGTGFGNTGACIHVIEYGGLDSGNVSNSCTYSGSGTWTIQGSDNCVLSSVTNLGGNNVVVEGAGTLTVASGGGFTNTLWIWVKQATMYTQPGARVLQ